MSSLTLLVVVAVWLLLGALGFVWAHLWFKARWNDPLPWQAGVVFTLAGPAGLTGWLAFYVPTAIEDREWWPA